MPMFYSEFVVFALRKAFNLSTLSMFDVSYSQILFIRLRKFPFIPSLLSLLSWKSAWFCQMLFLFTLILYSQMYFVLVSINMVYCNDVFCMYTDFVTLHSWDKLQLIMVYNPLYILLDTTSQYFVEDFGIYIHEILVCSLLVMSLSSFGIRVILTS